jgi:hypothetical protein
MFTCNEGHMEQSDIVISLSLSINNVHAHTQQLAFMSLVKMDDRISTYTKEVKQMERDFVHLTNDMSGRMGLDFAASWAFPLYSAILGSQFISLFLEQVSKLVLNFN